MDMDNELDRIEKELVEENVAQIRTDFAAADAKRDANKKTPDDILRFDNISYGNDSTWQILDVYKPKNAEKKLPVIVNVHGGAWVYGTKEVYQFYCMNLAQHGFAVVNFTYRLAPEHKFPASLEDTNAVFKWILQNQEEYGFDCNNIFAVGDSAGANLLGLYSAICTNPDFRKRFDFDLPENLKINAVALNCGKFVMNLDEMIDVRFMAMMKALINKESKFSISDIDLPSKITFDFPPTLLMTCRGDSLNEEIIPMMKAFYEYSVPYQVNVYGTKNAPLWHVFHCDPDMPQAKLCNNQQCDFFRNYMR